MCIRDRDYIDVIEMWFRDVLLFKVTKDANNLVFMDDINYIRKQASKSSYEGLENILRGCETAKQRLDANVNFDLAIELMPVSYTHLVEQRTENPRVTGSIPVLGTFITLNA